MNNTSADNQFNDQYINQRDDIDLIAVWYVLIQRKWTIFQITGFFTAFGIIYSLLATPYFNSTISMYPAGEIADNNSLFGGNLQGIAESFGIGGVGSTPTYTLPDIINSRRLKKAIVLKLWSNSLYPNGSNLIKYWRIDKPTRLSSGRWLPKLFPSRKLSANLHFQHIETAIKNMSKLISVDENESGLITVSVLMEEPKLAADIANFIAKYLKDFILLEQRREAEKNKLFIYDQQILAKEELALSEEGLTEYRKQHPIALDTPDLQLDRGRLMRNVEANQAVYITLLQQYEMAKIEEAKENLLVNILDNAEPSVYKVKPKRKLIVFFVFFTSLFLSSLYQIISINFRNKSVL